MTLRTRRRPLATRPGLSGNAFGKLIMSIICCFVVRGVLLCQYLIDYVITRASSSSKSVPPMYRSVRIANNAKAQPAASSSMSLMLKNRPAKQGQVKVPPKLNRTKKIKKTNIKQHQRTITGLSLFSKNCILFFSKISWSRTDRDEQTT